MTLTEQWNKGKLPKGDYYTKRRNGYILYDNINSQGVWRNSIDEDIEEILAPVPSYEEWQEEQKALKVLAKAYCKRKEETQQLKELLKECREKLKYCVRETYELQTKIDNAIGEKK